MDKQVRVVSLYYGVTGVLSDATHIYVIESNNKIIKLNSSLVVEGATSSAASFFGTTGKNGCTNNYVVTNGGYVFKKSTLSLLPYKFGTGGYVVPGTDEVVLGNTLGDYAGTAYFTRYTLSDTSATVVSSYSAKLDTSAYGGVQSVISVGSDIVASYFGYVSSSPCTYLVRIAPGTGNVVWARRIVGTYGTTRPTCKLLDYNASTAIVTVTSPMPSNTYVATYYLDLATGALTSAGQYTGGISTPISILGDFYHVSTSAYNPSTYIAKHGAGSVDRLYLRSAVSGTTLLEAIHCAAPGDASKVLCSAKTDTHVGALYVADLAGFAGIACGKYEFAAQSGGTGGSAVYYSTSYVAVSTPTPLSASAPVAPGTSSTAITVSPYSFSFIDTCYLDPDPAFWIGNYGQVEICPA